MAEDNNKPQISDKEQQEVEERSSPHVRVMHGAIRKEGDAELARTSSALAWSGLAAGLSMGFSLVAEGLLKAHLPAAPWAAVISKLGYSLGFLIVILGKQQLFTENTIVVIIPLLMNPTLDCLRNVARLWAIVLVTNLVGVFIFSTVIAHTDIFSADARKAFEEIGFMATQPGFGTVLLKGIIAGWLIALIIWLLPMAETGRITIIIILTYIVGLGNLSHVIVGSSETFYLFVTGQLAFYDYFVNYFLPALIGNVVGGISFATAINHAQVVAGEP